MKSKSQMVLVGAFAIMAALVWPHDALAIPAMARKFNVACQACHTVMPELNPFGKAVQEAGFRMPAGTPGEGTQMGTDLGEGYVIDKFPPLSFRIKGYPVQYINEEDEGEKGTFFRPLHELEILSYGAFGDRWSYKAEMEFEDEDNFDPGVVAAVEFEVNHALKLFAGYAPLLAFDPYNTFKDGGHRIERTHHAVMNFAGTVDAKLRKDGQLFGLRGRAGKVFYLAAMTPGPGQKVPELEQMDGVGRLVVDVTDRVSVGALGYYAATPASDTARIAADLNAWLEKGGTLKSIVMYDTDAETVLGELAWDMVHKLEHVSLFPLARADIKYKDDLDAGLTAGFGTMIENGRVWLEFTEPIEEGDAETPQVTLAFDVVF
ncbi:MAG: hypothetical protein D6761_07285 [Candidatus Dadabacteria bacterium]|nr:MAG: hypothetical protein D6761_07285 [Candidatus Dadabacteria bacterium]